MFSELFECLMSVRDCPLEEALTASQIRQLRAELSEPEIRPCSFDRTIPGWLERIKHWGKVSFQYKDEKGGNHTISKDQFIRRISDPTLNKMLGLWEIERVNQTTCKFTRNFPDAKGKVRKEEFKISVELRKELR